MKQFYYEGTVPKNQAVVWGSNLESFDSRYWGFIEYRQLKTMLLLL
ncbi:S26 family signal peptidase [Bathymodiolus thermophilus thioautotrophic gill symbiont]